MHTSGLAKRRGLDSFWREGNFHIRLLEERVSKMDVEG